MTSDFTPVTEVPGLSASREQLTMLYTRYAFAAERCRGKCVLEVACGAGLGLGFLAKTAGKVVGGDYTENLVEGAQHYYRGLVPLLRLDAQALPFHAQSFDVVLLYEALYYLAQPTRFFEECRRVLRKNGVLIICTVNKEWPEFNPSPFSTRYWSAEELSSLLQTYQFGVELLGAFPVTDISLNDRVIAFLKRLAVKLNLMPKTMKGKELLKRIFFGRLIPLPAEVQEGLAPYSQPVPISDRRSVSSFKVLFVLARQ